MRFFLFPLLLLSQMAFSDEVSSELQNKLSSLPLMQEDTVQRKDLLERITELETLTELPLTEEHKNITDKKGRTVLDVLLELNFDLVKQRVKNGADPEINSKNGDEILKINFKLSEKLIKNGANPNVQAENGETLLHWAAKNGYFDIAKWAIDIGVNIDAENMNFKTALDLSRERGNNYKKVSNLIIKKKALKGFELPSLTAALRKTISSNCRSAFKNLTLH